MTFLYIVLGCFVSSIFFQIFTQGADSNSSLQAMMAATIILSGSIWGATAWVVKTLKELNLPKSYLDK